MKKAIHPSRATKLAVLILNRMHFAIVRRYQPISDCGIHDLDDKARSLS
jgi:hypothetical protein